MEYLGMLASLRLAHLRAFAAVASHASMQSAARSLGISQPAISKLIHDLEEMFDTELFTRGRRGVVLTDTGHALASRTELLLNDLVAARDEISALSKGVTGRIIVGMLPVAEARIVPRALLRLLQSAPGISVQIEEGTTAALLGSLRRGEIDCVLGRLGALPVSADLSYEKLLDLPISIVVGSKHPLTGVKRLTWLDLAGYKWIMPRAGAPVRSIIEARFAAAGVSPPEPVVQSTATHLNAVLLGESNMIGVMGVDAASEYARAGALAILDTPMPTKLPAIGLVARRGRVSRALQTFLEALREEASQRSP